VVREMLAEIETLPLVSSEARLARPPAIEGRLWKLERVALPDCV
jgi:hypothetical protein